MLKSSTFYLYNCSGASKVSKNAKTCQVEFWENVYKMIHKINRIFHLMEPCSYKRHGASGLNISLCKHHKASVKSHWRRHKVSDTVRLWGGFNNPALRKKTRWKVLVLVWYLFWCYQPVISMIDGFMIVWSTDFFFQFEL